MSEPVIPASAVQIVRGALSDEELAALIAVLARTASPTAESPSPPNAWADPARRLRSCPHPRRGAWRNV
ncbi:MAG TPA: acyl-CoA carboxylase subunit epsilon [Pseudonocardiaceae bacterium]|nr:acyl-CoA carboxylase subunit epsilon [Pseudonocardiaceae bacterium]